MVNLTGERTNFSGEYCTENRGKITAIGRVYITAEGMFVIFKQGSKFYIFVESIETNKLYLKQKIHRKT